jgi:hypothetical protein
MKRTATVAQMLVRITGLVQIVLGVFSWSGGALFLVPVHMLVGMLLVLALWTIAAVALAARVRPGLAVAALVWGLVVPFLGVLQDRLAPGDLHWVVRALHLLVGLGAIALAEALATRIQGRPNPWSRRVSGRA